MDFASDMAAVFASLQGDSSPAAAAGSAVSATALAAAGTAIEQFLPPQADNGCGLSTSCTHMSYCCPAPVHRPEQHYSEHTHIPSFWR